MKIFEQKKGEKELVTYITRWSEGLYEHMFSFRSKFLLKSKSTVEPTDIKLNNCKKEHEASSLMLI